LEEASLPSYSQVATDEEMTVRQKNPPTAPLYPDLTGAIEKAMPASDISESDEPATVEPSHKSHIDRKYDRIARQSGLDIKRNGSLREKEAALIVAERNTRERLDETSIQTPTDYEILEKFHHDLVEIDKLKWYMEDSSLQPSEISMNTSPKKTIPKTLVTPLLEGHEIEWAEITEDTLKEFPHLSDRLKMQDLFNSWKNIPELEKKH